MSYKEALRAPKLPEHPPSYDDVVNGWPYRYPALKDANGNAVGPPPRYDEYTERAADPATPPSYAQARADAVSALEKEMRNFSQNMGVHLKKEFLLPFPGETEVSEAGGSRTPWGREMAVVRGARLTRQDERLADYRRGLSQLRQRIDQLSVRLGDSEILERLLKAHAEAMTEYGSYESAHELARPSGIEMPSLASGDVPFERWGKEEDSQSILRDARHLYDEMGERLRSAFSERLPRAEGLRARFSQDRARRNELRYERRMELERRDELVRLYRERLAFVRDQRRQRETSLRMNPGLWDELGLVLDEIDEFLLPFRIENDRHARRRRR